MLNVDIIMPLSIIETPFFLLQKKKNFAMIDIKNQRFFVPIKTKTVSY